MAEPRKLHSLLTCSATHRVNQFLRHSLSTPLSAFSLQNYRPSTCASQSNNSEVSLVPFLCTSKLSERIKNIFQTVLKDKETGPKKHINDEKKYSPDQIIKPNWQSSIDVDNRISSNKINSKENNNSDFQNCEGKRSYDRKSSGKADQNSRVMSENILLYPTISLNKYTDNNNINNCNNNINDLTNNIDSDNNINNNYKNNSNYDIINNSNENNISDCYNSSNYSHNTNNIRNQNQNQMNNNYFTTTRNFSSYWSKPEETFYDILGVTKECSSKEIKSAYYKEAKKCHPDLNPNDAKATGIIEQRKFLRNILKIIF